ncbi:glycosyltransferase family 4 protein [Conyzicola sp.]|uniref:glycosyltransferase family 4 protein n=1 Tax=Conyzicola sp. TaxID=1969404 RepID=UPI003988B9BD
MVIRESRPARRWLVATTEYAGLTAYTGGIGSHYAALLPAIVESGTAVDLMVFSTGPLKASADLRGVRLARHVDLGRMPRVFALPLRALLVRAAAARSDYDRIFLAEWGGLGAALPRRAPLVTNLATSMRLANEISGLTPEMLPRATRAAVAVQNALEGRQITRSHGVVPISRAMLLWAECQYPDLPPAVVVRNCIDVAAVVDAASTAGLPVGWPEGDAPVVLFLGRLERRKGVTDAVRAFAEVASRHPEARLVLAGASGDSRFEPTKEALLELLPAQARERVFWLGHVADASLYRGIREATVAICPSPWEGFGNVALEIKAAGCPLVCTTGSGFDDFCVDGEDSLMVPPADAAALAGAIIRFLGDSHLRDRLTRTASQRVWQFAPGVVAAALVSAADQLVASSRR